MANQKQREEEVLPYWLQFKKGLLLFVVSVLLILAGYRWHALLQIPGLLLLFPALFFAIRGYYGILKYRLSLSFSIFKK